MRTSQLVLTASFAHWLPFTGCITCMAVDSLLLPTHQLFRFSLAGCSYKLLMFTVAENDRTVFGGFPTNETAKLVILLARCSLESIRVSLSTWLSCCL
jgi:hypothetical protein